LCYISAVGSAARLDCFPCELTPSSVSLSLSLSLSHTKETKDFVASLSTSYCMASLHTPERSPTGKRRIHVTKPDLMGQGLAELAGNISSIIFCINEGWHIAEISSFANGINLLVVYKNKILKG
jgi:hypothetical protein